MGLKVVGAAVRAPMVHGGRLVSQDLLRAFTPVVQQLSNPPGLVSHAVPPHAVHVFGQHADLS